MKKLAMVLTLVLMASASMGAAMFTTDFGTGYDAYLDVSTTPSVNWFGTPTNSLMHVAKTKDADYLSADWIATVTYGTVGNRVYQYLAVGLGNPSAAWTYVPGDDTFWMAAYCGTTNSAGVVSDNVTLENFAGDYRYGGTITITKLGDDITFAQERAGAIFTSATYDISSIAPYLNDTNSKLFFTTSDPDAYAMSFSVAAIPEPATMMCLLAGIALTAVSRQRNMR